MQYTLKKSLGQHFLHNETICQDIVEALTPETKALLEIGPGAGAITKYLIQKEFQQYICVELDQEKVAYLLHTYPVLKDRIRNEDFLKMQVPFEGSFNIIGNFPYNISTQIMFKVLEWKHQVQEIVGMFQKEVAKRIAAKHGNKEYGILSVLTQCYYDIEYLFDVPPEAFTPPPKVMSGVIRMRLRDEPLYDGDINRFTKFVKACFNQRRKTLRNGLKSYYPTESLTDEVFNKRAEQLSVKELIELYRKLS